tara:strand:+ start:381 stop:1031 length:651 start_codon:yes stop_codon:yes gene_type:complete
MNIIDTRSDINLLNPHECIKNIPLFQIKGVEYELKSKNFTDIIFQSIASVKFFNESNILENKRIFSMGASTKKFLLKKGINSVCPKIPGSFELNKLLLNDDDYSKYLIIKGEDGLSDVYNHLSKNGKNVQELVCYKRFKLKNYEIIKGEFFKADAIIFSSIYAVKIFFDEIYAKDTNAKLFGISNRIIDYISGLGYEGQFVDYFSDNLMESVKDSI